MRIATRQSIRPRWAIPFLAALVAVLATIFGAATASAATTAGAETRVRAPQAVAHNITQPPQDIRAGQRLGNDLARPGNVVATGVAAETGGAASVRLGQAGEAAVRGAYDIGPKATIQINGRTRILDGLNDTSVTEVKNVGYQAYTQQLKDSLAYAQQTGRQFDLYVRGGANPTTLSGPLDAAIRSGDINLRAIP